MTIDQANAASEMNPAMNVAANGAAFGALPALTLRAYALAALAARVKDQLPGEAPNAALELRYLREQLAAVSPGGESWIERLPDYLNWPDAGDQPLLALAEELRLTLMETLAVALAAATEDDVMVGRALAYLQAPLGGSRPTLGLLATALAESCPPGERPLETLVTGNAVRSGLLYLLNEGAPLPERAVGIPLPLCLALGGQDAAWPGTEIGLGATPATPLPPSIAEEAGRQAVGLRDEAGRALVLRTGSTTEGKSVAAAIAQSLGCRAVFLSAEPPTGLGPWLRLCGLVPVFCFDLGPGERKVISPLAFYPGPMLALCGPDGSVEFASGTALSWSLPVPSMGERAALWEAAIGDRELAAKLASQHRHSSGRIAHLGRLARHHRSLHNPAPPSPPVKPTQEDVIAASWTGEGAGLDALAQALPDRIADEALILPDRLLSDLELFLLRCRARDGLVERLGASAKARYRPGVRGLFVGPSGTGKTLAAGWLATKLGLPLYRVDLASVTSKYIGETEKNLAQLLARAEQAEVVLLFDEADSMFGKRTDINDANDRFANAQTNYLLQRIESFDGITILTSNSRARFDDAFTRRLDLIIEFPTPGPEDRRRLWLSHLGTNHKLTPAELNQLASEVDFCGGNIRNAVLVAAVLAHSAGRRIEYADLIVGLISEYRKLGRQLPSELQGHV